MLKFINMLFWFFLYKSVTRSTWRGVLIFFKGGMFICLHEKFGIVQQKKTLESKAFSCKSFCLIP